jgi:Protein of unknown function (DUF2490)
VSQGFGYTRRARRCRLSIPWLCLALVAVVASLPTLSAAQTNELLPEIDVYYKFNSNVRVVFQTKETREGGLPVTAEIGPSVEIYLKRLGRLVDTMAFDKDDSKTKLLLFSAGYRYLPYPSAPSAQRFEPYIIINVGTWGSFSISDKNRADLDWQNRNLDWHYRNKITVERPFKRRNYNLAPYVSAEFWYTSQYEKWSTVSIFAGCLLPLGKHFDFVPYYEHQNNNGKKPNQVLNQFGPVLRIWF